MPSTLRLSLESLMTLPPPLPQLPPRTRDDRVRTTLGTLCKSIFRLIFIFLLLGVIVYAASITWTSRGTGRHRWVGSYRSHAVLVPHFDDKGNTLPADVPIYPGAKKDYTFDSHGTGRIMARYVTSDPPASVRAFYRTKLPAGGWKFLANSNSLLGPSNASEDDVYRREPRTLTIQTKKLPAATEITFMINDNVG